MEQIPNLSAKHSFNILRKASAIIHKGLIIPSFSKGCYHVTSSSDSKPHYVERVKEGVYKCDPEDPRNGSLGFKKDKICSHVVAAAKTQGDLASLIINISKERGTDNITKLALHGIAHGAGKKRHKKRKHSKREDTETVTTAEDVFEQPVPMKMTIVHRNATHVAVPQAKKSYVLALLEDHSQVNVCAGCPVRFPHHADKRLHPAPDNLIISHKEHGSKRLPSGVLQVYQKESTRYYHPNIVCVRRGNNGENAKFTGNDVYYSGVQHRLEDSHRTTIKKNLEIVVP